MGKAEVGSTKYLSNQMRRKGLQKLKWWCELCSKQCFDDNGFKLHCQSESHMRNALSAGQNFRQAQDDFSDGFVKNFLQLLKTGHGEKEIHINR
jgi:DNA/RNA-binding protein KIN17